jgi:hypothetical protein
MDDYFKRSAPLVPERRRLVQFSEIGNEKTFNEHFERKSNALEYICVAKSSKLGDLVIGTEYSRDHVALWSAKLRSEKSVEITIAKSFEELAEKLVSTGVEKDLIDEVMNPF